ncbi:phosphatase PAP2 family protein [Kocuria sp.]|uniref:phosphatase PAP2 family protein n=1 Tax=Kocuria sp. TaxID=1871328 RepID=UPI0026DD5BA0|nr:phosphatase PAP2 family protein [Kocuria sp.]MDO4919138.1 phosphatase PAP2 family protein [Kocuria sp.]
MTTPAQYSSPSPGGSPWHLPQLRHRVAVPLVVMLLTATAGRLLVLSPRITDGETALLEGLSQHRNVLLDAIATVAALALSNGGVVLIIAAVIGWLAVLRRRPLDATGFGITALSGWAAVGLVKLAVGRPRPVVSGDSLGAVTGSMSFPSSHAGAVVAIVLGLALVSRRPRSRRALLLWGTLAVAVVAAARVYSGAHYPLDVLAALPVAFVGTMAGASVANTVVPALAYGFSWHQAGTTVAAPATRRTTPVPAREQPAAATAAASATASHADRRTVRPASARHDDRADRAA